MQGDKSPVEQINIRMPSELRMHLERLAQEDGLKIGPFCLKVFREHIVNEFAQIGREKFMQDLEASHQAETTRYNALFDEIEAQQ
jgi:hypothetical protein